MKPEINTNFVSFRWTVNILYKLIHILWVLLGSNCWMIVALRLNCWCRNSRLFSWVKNNLKQTLSHSYADNLNSWKANVWTYLHAIMAYVISQVLVSFRSWFLKYNHLEMSAILAMQGSDNKHVSVAGQIVEKIKHLVKQAWNLACMFTVANFHIKAHWPRKNSKWRTKWWQLSKWPPLKTRNYSLLPKHYRIEWFFYDFCVKVYVHELI